MVIYIDLVILLNFIIDCLLLIGVQLLLKRKVKFKRIALASLLGSASTILLFLVHSNYLLLLYKLIISILMVIIAFKYESFHYFKENLFWLYIISIILGGSVYLLNNQITLTNQGIVFSASGFKINVIILIIIGPIIIFRYLKYQKTLTFNYSNYYDVDIYYKGIKISEMGFLDTGNKLVDPYFGRPIILVNKKLITIPVRTFFVPYTVVGGDGLLEVFKPEKIVVNQKTNRKVLVGISDVELNGIKIILNREAI